MFYKVKIKKIPTARVGMQVQGALSNDTMPFNGKGTTQMNSVPAPSVKKTLQPVARKDANLEAEKGETVIGNIDGSNMPSLFNIGGKRHVNGGTPLNLPDDSFIFSDTKSMMIKDPQILKMFGKSPRKGGYTPADLSKSYDMNKYRKILQDKNSDAIDKRTAEMMIKNFVIKLGALALAQESQKGFPQGIPALAKPYMETNGITEEDLIPPPPQPAPAPQQQMGQQQMPAPQTMPDGSPIAQPQTMEQDMAQMQQPTPNQMMQWGGVRMLKRAQEGMQQQQAQQQEDPMQQMMQQVQEALQQGAQPEEVAAQLIQNQVPPDQVAQIFVQLGMPEEQVQELVSGVMQQMQGGQEQQMDPRQQQQQLSEEEMMAMQQQDPQQMQQAPMAMYGMQMGGYSMPFAQDGLYFEEGERMAGDPNIPWQADYNRNINPSYSPRPPQIKNTTTNWIHPNLPDSGVTTPYNQWADMHNNPEKYKNVELTPEELNRMNKELPIEPIELPEQQYGGYMELGGYDMPDYMAYGGSLPKAQDGIVIKPYEKANIAAGNVTPMGTDNKFSSKGIPLPEYLKSWESNIPGISKMSEGEAQKAMYEWSLKNNPDAISNMWGTHGLTEQGMRLKDQKALSTNGLGTFTAEQLKDPALLAKLQASYVDQKFGIRQLDPTKPPPPVETPPVETPPVETPCPCVDDKGVAMKNADGTPMLSKKDPVTGKCLPCTEPIETCECKKEDGTKFDPGKNTDGTCKDCDTPGIKPTPTPTPAKWWLQDTVNTMGAFGDLARVKKQMPWEARVDLEEPRPTFLDSTKELAQQSEQANIASQASGQFAGAQAQGARLSAIQGQGAESAANTLSRINNANVGIANQFEGQQVGIRNQEQMANQQMANRVYDKNVIANQQFDNAKTAGRSNLRQSYNTGVTNKWKTDALNQMYPNYQTDPSVGGRVAYTPTDKTLDKTAEDESFESFINSIRDESPEIQKAMIAHKYPKARGGQSFEYGGFVYNVFPD